MKNPTILDFPDRMASDIISGDPMVSDVADMMRLAAVVGFIAGTDSAFQSVKDTVGAEAFVSKVTNLSPAIGCKLVKFLLYSIPDQITVGSTFEEQKVDFYTNLFSRK